MNNKKRLPNSVDIFIGKRIKMRRNILGLSQKALARSICVSTQQLQKYENAINRIPSGRLPEFAQILKVPIMHFFEDDYVEK